MTPGVIVDDLKWDQGEGQRELIIHKKHEEKMFSVKQTFICLLLTMYFFVLSRQIFL